MLDQSPLLHTKLHRPRLPHDLVMRPRLVDWLDQGLNYPVTLVCAAAGFGKSTLVSNWLEGMASLPSAWLSLDENDSDLSLFLSYFIAALRAIFPAACEQTLSPRPHSMPHSAMSSMIFPGNLSSFWMITTPSMGRRCTSCSAS
jgi:LuxR family transcriptional regulator, maltose regulon positive regulatory protein